MAQPEFRAAVGIGFQSPYPSHTHRKKPVGIPTESPYPQNPEILTHTHTPCAFSLDAYFTMLLCVFSNDNAGKIQKCHSNKFKILLYSAKFKHRP